MKTTQAKELLDKYRQGTINDHERTALESWYNSQAMLNPSLSNHHDFAEALKDLDDAFPFDAAIRPVKIYSWELIAAAASIILCLGIGLYFYTHRYTSSVKSIPFANDIKPGSNKAFLMLADGSRVSLTDAHNGEIARQAGVSITKTSGGQLIYEIKGKLAENNEKPVFNTIETPKGGQYQIKLPDGTRVWLNASSSLRYPVVFAGNRRGVNLKGEAYFEVARDKSKPFTVTSGRQELQVLGTHFNISAYTEDRIVKTTLLEGSVSVWSNASPQKNMVLRPGQQAVLSADGIKMLPTDTEEAVAWKNGYFKFNDEHIESILTKVARWYDVDIQYEGKMTDKIFNGKVSRYSNVSEVLDVLQLTGTIRFKIEGRRVIAMP